MRLNRVFRADDENSIKQCAFVFRSTRYSSPRNWKNALRRNEGKMTCHLCYDGVIINLLLACSNLLLFFLFFNNKHVFFFFFKDFIIKHRGRRWMLQFFYFYLWRQWKIISVNGKRVNLIYFQIYSNINVMMDVSWSHYSILIRVITERVIYLH